MGRTLWNKLRKLHLLTPGGLYRVCQCFWHEGVTLMALLRFAAHYYPLRTALVADGERLNYQELYQQCLKLAHRLHHEEGLRKGMCVGLRCRSQLTTTLLLPALSRLGVKVKLISTDISEGKMDELLAQGHVDRIMEDASASLNPPMRGDEGGLPRIWRGGDLTVLTGGSGGKRKEASRRMSVFQFLPPLALLEELRIDERESVFIPLPLYHGFGLATLIVALLMGKKTCLMSRFDAEEALQLIADERIEVLSLVPAMLARLWQTNGATEALQTVKCIISGGDRLDKKWADITRRHLGDVLFNLYGTSEAGFFMIASPEDLARFDEVPIGHPIRGVRCKVEDVDSDGTGTLWVRSGWAMTSRKNLWQNTGDRVCLRDGCYFHRGRIDNMVVCGGENVYPEHVEEVLNGHPDVVASIVRPAPDERFGTVLHAQVELKAGACPSTDGLREWLRPRLTRAEMPHEILIGPIGTTDTGKRKRH